MKDERAKVTETCLHIQDEQNVLVSIITFIKFNDLSIANVVCLDQTNSTKNTKQNIEYIIINA